LRAGSQTIPGRLSKGGAVLLREAVSSGSGIVRRAAFRPKARERERESWSAASSLERSSSGLGRAAVAAAAPGAADRRPLHAAAGSRQRGLSARLLLDHDSPNPFQPAAAAAAAAVSELSDAHFSTMAAVMPSTLATVHLPFSSVASTSALPPPPPQTTLASSSVASAAEQAGEPSAGHKKAHLCPYCLKTYSKRSKLSAHVAATHSPAGGGGGPAQATLPKPFPCPHPGCPESFGRKDHLDVHSRVHRPESERPFVCGKAGCGKRFWTGQHKRRHEEGCGVSGGSHQVRRPS
jgi:hypothetical protein